MNGRFKMRGGKNWIFPKEMHANRFFWDSHWLEIWSNHFCPSMGPNGGSVAMAMDSGSFPFSLHLPLFEVWEDGVVEGNRKCIGKYGYARQIQEAGRGIIARK
jgi:hypothetical protein